MTTAFPRPRELDRRARLAIASVATLAALAVAFLAPQSAGVREPAPEPAPATAAKLTVAPIAVPAAVRAVDPPAPPPPAAPPIAARPVPQLVRVAITSRPTGASVTLVDDGQTAVLGATPVDLSLDPDRGYDVVLALPGHATRITHFSPRTTHQLAIELAADAKPPAAQHTTKRRR